MALLQVTDGERLHLAVKELGSCDLYPQVRGCLHHCWPLFIQRVGIIFYYIVTV